MTDQSPRVLVVVPTYNEVENLASIVQRVRTASPDTEVLIVDDASPDGTGKLADEMAAEDSGLHVLHRAGKEGLGAAYLAGFDWALSASARPYDVICEMDADGSHHPEALPGLIAALEECDLAIGSRWVRGGQVQNWPRSRELISRAANHYARVMLRMPVRDVTAGFRAYRREALESIELQQVASKGYCFQIDLARRVLRVGMRIDEIPITFTDREHGVSKMSFSVAVDSWVRVTGWAFRDLLERYTMARRGTDRPSSKGSEGSA